MFIPSSSTLIISCCYILMIFFLKSSVSKFFYLNFFFSFFIIQSAYVADSNDITNSLIDQEFGLNIPSYFYDRNIRTTKFPRIGRSLLDSEEIASLFDLSSEENDDENDNESSLIEKRSVHFPRIGKRAFHNLLWANSRSNPHRMLDSQGRYYTNGYDYHIHQVRPQRKLSYRNKRNLPM